MSRQFQTMVLSFLLLLLVAGSIQQGPQATSTNSTGQTSNSSGTTVTNSTSSSNSSSGSTVKNSTSSSNSSSGSTVTNSTGSSNSSSGTTVTNSTSNSNSSSGSTVKNSTSSSNSSSGSTVTNSTSSSNSSSGTTVTNSTSNSNSSSGSTVKNSTSSSNSSSGSTVTNSTGSSNSSSGSTVTNSTSSSNSSSGSTVKNSTSSSNSSSGSTVTNSTGSSNSSSGSTVTNSTGSSNSSSGSTITNSTGSSNSSSGSTVTNSTGSSNSSSGSTVTNSTSNSNSSSGSTVTNSTSNSNSSSGSTVTNSTSSSNSSSGSTVKNSTSSSNSSSGSTVTNSTSQYNSSSEWNFTYSWYAFTYYKEEYQWSLMQWWNFFMRAQNMTMSSSSSSSWNYEEWYIYALSLGGFGCNSKSIVEVESAITMNIFQALTLQSDERENICVSLKKSIKLAKSIMEECEEQIEEDWDSSSTISVLHYTTTAQISEYKTTQHLICSSYDDSSENNTDSSEQEDEDMCDMIKQRDSLLAFLRLEMTWHSNGAGCSEASLALETIESAQHSCSWEVRSALSLILSQKRSFWITMCSPPTCNLAYADISLSSALMALEEDDDNNASLSQNATERICKSLKFGLASAMNHTIDCQRNIYSSISRKIEMVKKGYTTRCGALPSGPKPCVIAKPNTDMISSFGASFFFDSAEVCQAAMMYNAPNGSLGNYCDKNVSNALLSCFANNCSDKCENVSRPTASLFLNARACLVANGISNSTLKKVESFNLNLRRYTSAVNRSACPDQGKFEQLALNATLSILTGEPEPSFCSHAKVDIDQWFTSCGGGVPYVLSNVTALFSLVCPKTVQLSGCDYNAIAGCFDEINKILLNKDNLQNLSMCVKQAVANCAGPIADEALETVRSIIAAASTSPSPANDSAPCTCDPAAAVNCIMDVHHMSKQITPDWMGLCPKVPESETCARSYVEGCDECKKSTVLTIVHKLNSQLEDTCINPPVTNCSAVSAIQCVTDLARFQASSAGFGNDTVCIKITIARQCVYEKTEKCDELTSLSVMNTLEQVIMKWKGLKCQPPEDQLKNCSNIFETQVYKVLGISMYSLVKSLQSNESALWNKFTNFCEEVDFSFECVNATLSLQGMDIQAVIVRQAIEAVYKMVTKVCKSPKEPLQCYACQGEGQNSCAKGRSIESCSDKEICETTTSMFQNGSRVIERGCTPTTACKAGCDKKGCTYCCTDKLCNSKDDGPIEGTCNMTKVAGCVFSLSAGLIQKKNFQCSSATVAVGCINKEHLQCEIGGKTASLDSFTKLNLTAEIHVCLIEEAKQTCDVAPYLATCGYISQASSSNLKKDDLCMIIAESRNRSSQAASVCTKEQYSVIKKAQTAMEAVVGYLDCKEKFNFTIDIACKPVDARSCNNLTSSKPSCQTFNETVNCMRTKMSECSSAAQLLLVEMDVQMLKANLPAGATCTDVKLVDNLNITLTEVAHCLNVFAMELKANPITSLFNQTETLRSCIFNISEMTIMNASLAERASLETLIQFIQSIIEISIENNFQLNVTMPEPCKTNLTALFYKHIVVLLDIPFVSLDQRPGVCMLLNADVKYTTSNCDLNATADIFNLLDIMRERLFTGFCPDIQPITRCLIRRAEECYERFTTSFSYSQGDSLCNKAYPFIECAVNYTQTCTESEDLESFSQKASFVTDFVSQACITKPELVKRASCALLGRVEVQPGCIANGVQQCTSTQGSKCSGIENKAACLSKNAGTCLTAIPSPVLKDSLNEISQCRYGDQSHSSDESVLTKSCSNKSYTCDIDKSKNCLYNLVALPLSDVSMVKAQSCLEENYYCFSTITDLITVDIRSFAALIVYIKNISPSWSKLESKFLISLLRMTNYFNDYFTSYKYVTMDLWDMCWELNEQLEDMERINKTYPDEISPTTLSSIEKIERTISRFCNNLGDVAEELSLPADGKENASCPANMTAAYVNIMFSQTITEFVSVQNFTGQSVCSLYILLNQSLEAKVETGLSFSSCSSGFSAKVRFALKIVNSLLENRCQMPDTRCQMPDAKCQMPDNDVKRCDIERVQRCVTTLYQNYMALGINQTAPGLCKIFEETEDCVEKYSYKCDSCTRNRIMWMYSSTRKSVQQKCSSLLPPMECEDEEDETDEPDECNFGRATTCSVKQFMNFISPFLAKETKCRNMNENLDCISKAIKGCTGIIPKIVSQGAEKAKNILSDLGCKGDKGNMSMMSMGCRDGCWLSKAYKCITVFKSQVDERMQSSEQRNICQYINVLNMCVAQNTATCHEGESASVMQSLELVLEQFSDRRDSCVDVSQCSKDFDNLVRQIADLKSEDDSDDDNDDEDKKDENSGESNDDNDDEKDDDDDDEEDDDDDDDVSSTNQPSLNALCVQVKQSWECVQKRLNMLPGMERQVTFALYTQIWRIVEEKCSNTKPLECFYCKGKGASTDCESKTETCPHNKQTCMFTQMLSGNSVKYTAGCSSAKTCTIDTPDVRTYYCSSSLCNKKANAANTCELEPATCLLDMSLNCALKLSTHYIESESINCSSATKYLSCIQRYAAGCSNTKNLTEVVNKIFVKLASSTCVINAGSNDCSSLAITSMQTALGSAYVTEGNSVCVSLKETTESVNRLIAGGNCSEEGKVSLNLVLHFIRSIVGGYCSDDECPERERDDYMEEETSHCSGNIFDGIKNIYKSYIGLAKNESSRDCGSCADNALSARISLYNCKIGDRVTSKMNALDQELQNKCQIPDRSSLPEICSGVCQMSVVLNYTDNVYAAVNKDRSLTCWYLSQLQEVYVSYTSNCISVQQRDVVKYIQLKLGSNIAECKQKNLDFVFDLELKLDIYHDAMVCNDQFQDEIKSAYLTNNQTILCEAIAKRNVCIWDVPKVVLAMVADPSENILNAFKEQGICGDLGNNTNRNRRETTICQLERLSSLIAMLAIPPNIAITAIDSRSKVCQNIALSLEETTTLITECKDALSQFQLTIYISIKKNVEVTSDKSCLPLYSQIPKCDFKLMADCRAEYNLLSGYASAENDSLCRKAKYALECSQRFSMNCSSNDSTVAMSIQETFTAVIKQSLGNSCPLLTPYLYCNESFTVVEAACRLDEAKKCRSNITIDFTKFDDSTYCHALRDNVACVQDAASGCQADQIASIGWPTTARNGMCKITDASLNNVCQSVPVCSTQQILACFTQAKITSCQSLQVAVTCMGKYLNNNKQCQLSLDNALVQYYLSAYYSMLAPGCGVVFNISLPKHFGIVKKLLTTIDVVLSTSTTYNAADLLYYIYSYNFLGTSNMNFSLVREMINTTIIMVYNNTDVLLRPTGQIIQYNNMTDIYYKDTDKCVYSRARACIGSQIIRIYTFKLSTLDERNDLCDDWNANTVDDCITEALSGCAQEKAKFLKISSLSSLIIEHLGFCKEPEICLVSEAYECVNKFGTILATFDRDNDTKAMCLGRLKSQECMDGYLVNCNADKAKPVRDTFKSLSVKVEAVCQTVLLPEPPICPDIRDRNRVCMLGNAFLCLANFNNRILMTSDSLIWRQQCLEIQKMMVCIATNTTSCDPENADVKIILTSLKEFKTNAGYQCPWLTDDLCSIEPPCAVMTSGCDVDMERKLMNKNSTVCGIKKEAEQCVIDNTATCTEAQKEQGQTVINKKMDSLGLPKELSCQAGSIDGCLYTFLSAARDIYLNTSKSQTCKILASQYSCIVGSYSNVNNSQYLAQAKMLIDSLFSILNASQCTASSASICKTPLPVRKIKTLITQLALNNKFSTTSFCAKSLDILTEQATNDCNAALYSIITGSDIFKKNCTNDMVTCDVALVNITDCIKKIGVFSSLSCSDKQKAAVCITEYLPANCNFDRKMLVGDLCNDTVVLQVSGKQGKVNYISEKGLKLRAGFKIVAGSRQFKLKVVSRPAISSSVPRCQGNIPIPQVYTGMNPVPVMNDSNYVNFTISAVQDLRTDGDQAVNVMVYLIPTVVTINATTGKEMEQEVTNTSYTISTFTVNVEDCDQLNSMCSITNDPHIITFDGTYYNNQRTGTFILYRNIEESEVVLGHFYQCQASASCICAVTVISNYASLTFSVCKGSKEFATFISDTGADAQAPKNMAIFTDKDLNMYHVVLKSSRSIVSVQNSQTYLQLYIQPSPLVIDKSEGACGRYDSDAYNDFQMPDGTVYTVTENDVQFGRIEPEIFNYAWKINSSDMQNRSKIFYPGITATNEVMKQKCITVMNGSNDYIQCSDLVNIATCGFVSGEDQMSKFMAMGQQDVSTSSKTRKKRQVIPDDPEDSVAVVNPGWPTKSNWTQSSATDYCMDTMFSGPLQACSAALLSLSVHLLNFDDPVKTCVDDIRLSDSTIWIDGAVRTALQLCIKIFTQNPDFQKSNYSSELVNAFLNTTCIPSDCNGHGTCFRGQCICDKNYVGTGCDVNINNLRPPVLLQPTDGVYTCEIGVDSDCSSVFLHGTNLVSSPLLSCHIRTVQITETGIKDISSGKETIVRAEMIATNQVRCDLGGKSAIKRTLEVSVSNDGKLAYETYQVFIAYDPVCYDCTEYSCIMKSRICIIGNRCVREGESSVYSDCQYCNLTSPNDWSIRPGIPGCENMIPDKDKDSDKQTLITALIAVGCSVVVLLIILISVCVFMKRREARRKREAARRNGSENGAYSGDMPFHGQPVPAYKPNQLADNNLLPPKYQPYS